MYVINSGSLIGNVTANSAGQPDLVINHGAITGNVSLGTGNDAYAGVGRVSGTVFGEDGADSLAGGTTTDRLNGGTGNDTLNGGPATMCSMAASTTTRCSAGQASIR